MFFFPKLVETKKSHFNGEIKVYQQFGKYSISVDNLTQSGGLLVPIWKQALKFTKPYTLVANRCLILGLGGGTAAQIVRQMWPDARITSIEIDPVMVKLAQKYGSVKKVHIITADAFEKIFDLRSVIYDLILVDTYLGKSYPPAAKSIKNINRLKQLLTPDGTIIFNRLNWAHNDSDIQQHVDSLRSIFPHVLTKRILSNTLVFCHK